MLKDIKTVIARSDATLLHDAVGAVSLMLILFGALHFPGVL